MIEILTEIFFGFLEIVAEIALQAVGELLADLGIRCAQSWGHPQKTLHPAWAVIGNITLGVIAGIVSLLFLPHAMIANPTWRIISLAVAPIVAGLLMTILGAWRIRRGRHVTVLNRFSYAFLFALSLALTRFLGVR